MSQQNHLNPCAEPSPAEIVRDTPPPNCEPYPPNFKAMPGRPEMGWKDPESMDKSGYGANGNCDPMQAGKIINDPDSGDRNTVYRNSQAIRGTDEAMRDLFSRMVVLDEDGKAQRIPIAWASQERAVASILQPNVRKDDSLVVDRVRVPFMSITNTSFQFNQSRWIYHKAVDYMRGYAPNGHGFQQKERYEVDTVFGVARGIPMDIGYTLYAWTLYIEDMNQIIEQVVTKFSPMAYIRVRGVGWEIGVRLDSIASNLDLEPGDKSRTIKFEFNFTAETFIPQPIVRKKTVLKNRFEFLDGLTDEDATGVIYRLEEAVKELQ